jgi:carbonic anhydrase
MSQFKQFLERRDFLKFVTFGGLSLVTAGSLCWRVEQAWADELADSESLSPDIALKNLMEGNQRFVQQQPKHPNQSQARLQEVAQAQHPFVTILSCADSRVAAELIFDQGIGNIFDIRIAGNVAIPEAIGSIEYAVELLGTPLLMVLGHERCGAVTAAVQNEPLAGKMNTFVKAIKPAIAMTKGMSGNAVENVVIANVQYQIEILKRSPILIQKLHSGKLKIVGGRYDLDTGTVTLIKLK